MCFEVLDRFHCCFMKTQDKSVFLQKIKGGKKNRLKHFWYVHLDGFRLDATAFLTMRKSPKYCIRDLKKKKKLI